MGQLAEALRQPQRRRALHQSGGQFDYTDPMALFEDLVALKRAFPELRMLPNDNPLERTFGYLCYRTEGDREVVFYISVPLTAVREWDGPHGNRQHRAVAESFRTAEGRRKLVLTVEDIAKRPEVRPKGRDMRRSAWDRLVDDDEPL